MFTKLLVVIVFFTLLAAAVLGLREQRLVVRHQVARLHAAMDASRKHTWDLQVRVAAATRDQALRQSIQQSGLELQPVVPTLPQVIQPLRVRVAQAAPGRVSYARGGP